MELETDDHNLPEFFKVFIRQDSSNQLLIPRGFVEYMGGRRSGSAELMVGSSRRTWQVELLEVGKDLYFVDGWVTFVEDNFVREGEFLFFTLHGDLRFSVMIYDESMCKVDICEGRRNGGLDIRDEKNGDETAANEYFPSSQAEVDKTTYSVNPSFEKSVRQSSFVIPKKFVLEHSLNYESGEIMVIRTCRNSSWEVRISNQNDMICFSGGWPAFFGGNCFREGDICKFELLDRLEMMVHIMTREEGIKKKKIDVEASKIIPSNRTADGGGVAVTTESLRSSNPKVNKTTDSINPSFEKGITRSSLDFPKAFVHQHSLSYKRDEMMVLRTSRNSSWKAKIITKNDRICLSGGWLAFFIQNRFKAGDICKFELLDRLEMMVRIVTRAEKRVTLRKK